MKPRAKSAEVFFVAEKLLGDNCPPDVYVCLQQMQTGSLPKNHLPGQLQGRVPGQVCHHNGRGQISTGW